MTHNRPTERAQSPYHGPNNPSGPLPSPDALNEPHTGAQASVARADLRDRIAAALYERERPPRDPYWPDAYAADREVFPRGGAAAATPPPRPRPADAPAEPTAPERPPMTEPTVTDLRRELRKAEDALTACLQHLARHAEANAALHCAERVMYSPLHAKVEAAIAGIGHALARTKQSRVPTLDHTSPDGPWAALVADLDRCPHGRHQGDECGSCDGPSEGNPWLRPGMVIGHGLYGDPIVMPDREHKHDPAAWRSTDTTGEPR